MKQCLYGARADRTYWQEGGDGMWKLLTSEPQPQCIAILVKLGRSQCEHWRAAICRPAPQWFTPRFVSAEAASYALAKMRTADDAWCAETLHTPADTHWQSDFDTGSSRLAGGLRVAVRLMRGEWRVLLDGQSIGGTFTSVAAACSWIDNLLLPPAPAAFVQAVEGCAVAARAAVLSAKAVAPQHTPASVQEHAADVFAHAAAPHLTTLRGYGLDDAGENQFIRALMTGQHPAVWLRPFAAVVV
ncbi:hypothetical protein [Dyella sp. Tek66A03]|uniref:hypothetical protein n=1 Tax=Dyella sp. Tek66A03 TaxID=3458298 RepID=UPI00403E9A5D